MRIVRLALLLCDEIYTTPSAIKDARGEYAHIFRQFLSASLRQITTEVAFTLDAYDVVHDMAYPPDNVHYEGILIGGSRASANDQLPWVIKLLAYIKRVVADRHSLKIFGACFGHQVICKALGSPVEKGEWEVSVTTIHLTSIGRALFHADKLHLQLTHHDQVTACPPHAHLLGSTDIAPNQGIVIFEPASAHLLECLESTSISRSDALRVPLTSIQVFTFQGHFEFTEPIVRQLIPEFADELGPELVEDGLLRIGTPTDAIDKVGRVIWGVLGVTAERDHVRTRARL
ncbi:class I glutamine amidotransferase-like protein [Boletus reticuloceps]|uniref:Class I glutamine amidotransferase-like protein n=1 Tax=Boletus reticuloceps TaxID=495285 RepID=A0A8I2YJY4_9AGAM|nr:class I glutamine amidotransferase-like protein [Boletus reticuloceps]